MYRNCCHHYTNEEMTVIVQVFVHIRQVNAEKYSI